MEDKDTGLSIRFIRQYDPDRDKWNNTITMDVHDVALSLVMADDRHVPFAVKIKDAYTYMHERGLVGCRTPTLAARIES